VPDESVTGASPEASENVSGSVDAERKGRMRGGHDPRELARLSAEARARRRNAQQKGGGTPPGGSGEGTRPVERRLTGVEKVREERDLHQLSEDALVDLLNSPSETARVNAAKILHERSAPKEPEPVAARAPRSFPLEDVLRMAARAGLLDREEVLEVLREVWAEAAAESAAPVRCGPHADLEFAETPVETEDEVTDETATESGDASV
jgi:hypothetical protein